MRFALTASLHTSSHSSHQLTFLSFLSSSYSQDSIGEATDIPVLKLFEFLVASVCLFMIEVRTVFECWCVVLIVCETHDQCAKKAGLMNVSA